MEFNAKHVIIAAVAVTLIILGMLLRGCLFGGPPEIDPAAIAAAETEMWKAYYNKDRKGLFDALTGLMENQFGASKLTSRRIAFDLAQAAMKFISLRGDYEANVLPFLESAYAKAQRASGLDFDPAEAAQAELDWWVARRTPGHNSVEEVGQGIAKLYAVIYGQTNEHIERAGYLRAKSANVRDRTKNDWAEVQRLLEESYTELAVGVGMGESE